MKNRKRIPAILLMISLVVLLSGCEFHASFGIGNFITGLDIHTSSGQTVLSLPESGAQVADTASSGKSALRCGIVEHIPGGVF